MISPLEVAPAEDYPFQTTFDTLLAPLFFIAITFVAYYAISYVMKKRIQGTDDYMVAGRTIGPFVNGSAISATWESLATFMGVIALMVQVQIPFLAMWTNFLLSIPLIVILYGQTLRRLGSYTPATFCKDRYGNSMSVVMALLIVFVMLMYALGQFIGLAQIAEILFGWDYTLSLFVIAALVTGYVVISGMWGVSYNSALQFWLMLTAAFFPMMLVLNQLGSTGWFFPPLGYGDLVPEMEAAQPGFFDMTFDTRWYFAMFLAMALGPIGMPHLAQRIFTSRDVEAGRKTVFWFVAVSALMFATVYAVAFAGVMWLTQEGLIDTVDEADFDKMIFYLNFAFGGDTITGYVVAGAVAGGLSTVSGHMLAISAAVANDVIEAFELEITEDRKTQFGYASVIGAGLVIALIALNPPAFLVVSILWAFAISAAAITPVIVLGVWSARVNRYGAIASSIVGFVTVIVLSPHAFGGIGAGGEGLTADLGIDAIMIAFPLSMLTFIVVSLVAERIDSLGVDPESNRALINEMHGYPDDDVERFTSAMPLIILALLMLPILWWGIQPW
ncbi:sodium:solute symporter family transporter [Natrarchaeobaculum sulfurireducens]|uniref:Acetate permease ActP (Cation/acetatesymporter) n=1 Tax=Natrarchaeobaculum sulfurireducens TaxID=2044521 RepID=A0A346PU38_9EURY|nr:Na+:solute symporter [Natrarchaeobaculum sulfurireducens]AXR77000.1 Sodium:solute symporter [Natrarchaeobaculum sulfurireducens]AXR83033.1 Acetate permease ActP (cation/acetatesymporter) [Natrarchaeobaculum sulfurireducens]